MLLQVAEIYNFGQDDLMTEDIDILSCHSEIFVWVGQQVDPKTKVHALKIGEVFYHCPSFFCSQLLSSTNHQEIESLSKLASHHLLLCLLDCYNVFHSQFSGHIFLFWFFLFGFLTEIY